MKRYLSAAFLPWVFLLFALAFPPRAASVVNVITSFDTFVLSNEGSNGFVTQLMAGGYGNANLYDALVAIANNTNPSVAGIITPAFIATLASLAASSAIFQTQLKNFSVGSHGLAVSTDGTVQVVNISGAAYNGQSGTATLSASVAGVGSATFVYSTTFDSPPVTSFTSGGSTYRVIGIAYAPGSTPPSTPAPPTLWLVVTGCLALGGYALWSRRGKHA
jgi:hypothetical protein